jgi:hypothetical protein
MSPLNKKRLETAWEIVIILAAIYIVCYTLSLFITPPPYTP